MKPLDLINAARILVEHNPRRPTEACMRRAVSSIYYATFHCLASSCADAFVGGTSTVRNSEAWRRTYRSLEHGMAKNACSNRLPASFSVDIRTFAGTFATMQERRHEADYHPDARFEKSEVLAYIGEVAAAIIAFEKCSIQERRAFAAHVLLKPRK